MNTAPVCECPKCRILGLHLMPRVRTWSDRRTTRIAQLVEVPRTMWYDFREGPVAPVELKVVYKIGEVVTEHQEIVRECFMCGHEWGEPWKKEEHELRI